MQEQGNAFMRAGITKSCQAPPPIPEGKSGFGQNKYIDMDTNIFLSCMIYRTFGGGVDASSRIEEQAHGHTTSMVAGLLLSLAPTIPQTASAAMSG